MKFLVVLFVTLTAASAFSCPNLKGNSSCAQEDIFDKSKVAIGGQIHNIVIEQDKVKGQDSYHFQYKENDGVIRPHESVVVNKKTITHKYDYWTRTDIQLELTAKCQGDSLMINSKVMHNGEVVSETNEVLTQLPEKNFKHVIKGTAKGKPVSVTRHCQPGFI